MAKRELISTAEAARRKNCSRNAILAAIQRKATEAIVAVKTVFLSKFKKQQQVKQA